MEAQGCRMLRLVKADLTSARKRDFTNRTPSSFLHIRTVDALLGEGRHLGPQVFAHEIQLMYVVLIRRMERSLRRRQCEDQPTAAGVHGHKSKDVSEKGAISLRVLAVDDDMSANDHRLCPFSSSFVPRPSSIPEQGDGGRRCHLGRGIDLWDMLQARAIDTIGTSERTAENSDATH